MSLFDAFRYDGKRVLVVGGATGMGRAAAELLVDAGAEVVVMDRAETTQSGVKFIQVDLADKASIDAGMESCGGPVHALFSCAGVADGTPGLERINFLGHRHMIDTLVGNGTLGRGGSIGFISSAAGFGWEQNLPKIEQYLATPDYESGQKWAEENGKTDYLWSKLTINAYVAREALPLARKGIRINAILPGPTNTPLAQANKELWLTFAEDFRAETGAQPSEPIDQAYPLVFLCSDAARGITGITLYSDGGYFAAGMSKSFQPAADAVGFFRMEF